MPWFDAGPAYQPYLASTGVLPAPGAARDQERFGGDVTATPSQGGLGLSGDSDATGGSPL